MSGAQRRRLVAYRNASKRRQNLCGCLALREIAEGLVTPAILEDIEQLLLPRLLSAEDRS